MEKTITVLSVSYRSGQHLGRLFKNIYDKAKHPDSLQFVVVDNTNGEDRELKNHFLPSFDINFLYNNGKGLQRSVSHANALDIGLENLDTDYTLIIDPDVHIFNKGWDRLCIDSIENEKKAVIGAPYPSWKLGKVHDYPSVVFMFFRTKQIQNSDESFYPFPDLFKQFVNSGLRKLTRLGFFASKSKLDSYKRLRSITKWLEKITGITSPDTGNKIIEFFRKERYIAFNFEAPYSKNLELSGHATKSILAKEFEYYTYNDKPIMTHMYGSGVFHWKTKRGSDIEYWKSLIKKVELKL